MSFSATPLGFFGKGYALSSSEVKIPTSDFADITVGTFTTDFATDNALTFASYHNLKVGDKVSLTTATTLPSPLQVGTDYFVKTASGPSAGTHTVTLAATRSGTEITLTDDGTGAHTLAALAPLQEVTDTEAHATTGDWRKVVFGLSELMFQKYNNTASADRPTNVTIRKNESPNVDTGITTIQYIVTVKILTSGAEVAPE